MDPNQNTANPEMWHEPLPEGCPPEDAVAPLRQAHYRAVKSWPPADEDFVSQRALQPGKVFDCSECRARAVSFFLLAARCHELLKLPTFRGGHVASVVLPTESGVSKVTNRKTQHVAWWRRSGFNPLEDVQLVDEE